MGFPVSKKENFAGLQAHRKRGKSARASPTPHHTLNEERSARFTAQPLSALVKRYLTLVSTSGRKNVMSMRELFCPDPLAGFEKMAGFQIFYCLKIKCFHS